jgi:hypothetical protein
LSCLPTWPQYCRATPTECLPFFLRNAGIVDHPDGEGRTGGHLRQDVVADGLEEKLVIPGRYGNYVMQGLMSAPDIVGVETGLGSRRGWGRDERPWVPRFCALRATGGQGSSWLRADAGPCVLPLAPDAEGRRQDAVRVGLARGGAIRPMVHA